MKEGISFQEAYLIPIPIVAADVDESPYTDGDEPTIVATQPYNVDVPIAEPAEYYSLIRNRNFRYDDDDW
jgi:hypothetical protein